MTQCTDRELEFVRVAARKSIRYGLELRRDLEQEGMLALVQKAQTHDPSTKVKLLSYAHNRVKGAIYDSLRTSIRSSDRTVYVGHLDFKIPDVSESVIEQIHRKEQLRQVMAVVNTLPARWKQAICLRYFCELTHVQIGEIMGIRGARVSQILNRALSSVRKQLGVSEFKARRQWREAN